MVGRYLEDCKHQHANAKQDHKITAKHNIYHVPTYLPTCTYSYLPASMDCRRDNPYICI